MSFSRSVFILVSLLFLSLVLWQCTPIRLDLDSGVGVWEPFKQKASEESKAEPADSDKDASSPE